METLTALLLGVLIEKSTLVETDIKDKPLSHEVTKVIPTRKSSENPFFGPSQMKFHNRKEFLQVRDTRDCGL